MSKTIELEIANSRAIIQEWKDELNSLDPEKDSDQIQCLQYWISDAELDLGWMERELDNVS